MIRPQHPQPVHRWLAASEWMVVVETVYGTGLTL